MFEVVNTFVVIETIKGKIKRIAIDNPTFVVLSNFLMFFIISNFKLFNLFIIQCIAFTVRQCYAMHSIFALVKFVIFVTNKTTF